MGVSSTTSRRDYTGNGSTATYAYTFKVFAESELLVTVVKTATGEETTLTLSTDYTVTGVGETSGGNVVLVDADQLWIDSSGFLATGYEMTIRRVLPLTQQTDIRNQGAYYASLHEDQFDRLVMIDQQQQDDLDRCIKVPETEAGSGLELPSSTDRASSYLAFDADGDPIASDGGISASIPVSTFMETVLDDTTSAAARTTLGAQQLTDALTALGAVPDPLDLVPIYDVSGSVHRKVTVAQARAQPTAAKTTTYVLSSSDYFVTADSDGAAFTMTLPDCASNPGRIFRIKKVGSAFATANAVTIARAGADTIFDTASGTSTTLHTPGEEVEIISLGSTVWQVMNRRTPSAFAAYTPTFTGFGTASAIECAWRRTGDSVHLNIKFTCGTSTATEAQITLPAGLTSAATPKITSIRAVGTLASSGTDAPQYFALIEPSVAYMTFGYQVGGGSSGLTKVLGNALFSGTQKYSYSCIVPITGWNG